MEVPKYVQVAQQNYRVHQYNNQCNVQCPLQLFDLIHMLLGKRFHITAYFSGMLLQFGQMYVNKMYFVHVHHNNEQQKHCTNVQIGGVIRRMQHHQRKRKKKRKFIVHTTNNQHRSTHGHVLFLRCIIDVRRNRNRRQWCTRLQQTISHTAPTAATVATAAIVVWVSTTTTIRRRPDTLMVHLGPRVRGSI